MYNIDITHGVTPGRDQETYLVPIEGIIHLGSHAVSSFAVQKNEHKCVPCHHHRSQEAFQVINGTAYIASSLLVLCPKQKHGAHLKKNQSFFRSAGVTEMLSHFQ